jgi:hypothetical protein
MPVDLNGCKPLFGKHVVAHTTVGKEFVGTLEPISGSTSTVTMVPLPADVAAHYLFAINGVKALDTGAIAFMQDLDEPH